MKRQPWCSFALSGVSLTDFGLEIPSPFCSLSLSNSEIQSVTSWTLNVIVGGEDKRKINIAAFEALLYSAAQAASAYKDSQGIPVSFAFGWLGENGGIEEYISYQGFTLQFKVSTTGLYMRYEITGFASLAVQCSMPVIRIPEVQGFVQPSAVVEGLAKALKATSYYELDIDHNDVPTLILHGAMTTSFNKYVRGTFDGTDDYESFPGLVRLAKSYNGSRDSAGVAPPYRKLSQILNNISVSSVDSFLKKSLTDTTPQSNSFSYWVDEPTMTRPGVIHFKSNAGLMTNHVSDALVYGTPETNILSISGSYNGVAYNMTDMKFEQVGFTVDASGGLIIQDAEVVNSWSSSLAEVFQTVDIINDVNAIATQFSGEFVIQIPGSVKKYEIAQPVSLVVMSGNTLSPISGVYNIISVAHQVSSTFITTLKIQRLTMSSANQVAASQGIYVSGSSYYPSSSYSTTSNIISPHFVDFGELFPNFEHMYIGNNAGGPGTPSTSGYGHPLGYGGGGIGGGGGGGRR